MCNSAIYAIFHQFTNLYWKGWLLPKNVDFYTDFPDTRPAQVDNHPKLVDIYKFDTFNF